MRDTNQIPRIVVESPGVEMPVLRSSGSQNSMPKPSMSDERKGSKDTNRSRVFGLVRASPMKVFHLRQTLPNKQNSVSSQFSSVKRTSTKTREQRTDIWKI